MYARGSKAFGYCDRTGFRYPLKDLVPEVQERCPHRDACRKRCCGW